jgi:hypothetical protein
MQVSSGLSASSKIVEIAGGKTKLKNLGCDGETEVFLTSFNPNAKSCCNSAHTVKLTFSILEEETLTTSPSSAPPPWYRLDGHNVRDTRL